MRGDFASKNIELFFFQKIVFLQKFTNFCRHVEECGAVRKCVTLVDLVKSFASNEYLLAKFGFDTAGNGGLSTFAKN